MITTSETVVHVVALLREAPFEFSLTGSRFFGYDSKKSDWDFFVGVPKEDMERLQRWLQANNFVRSFTDEYTPPPIDPFNDALEVWVHLDCPVHIQVVQDAISKSEIQDIVKRVPGLVTVLGNMPKGARSLIWKMARAVHEDGKRKSKDTK